MTPLDYDFLRKSLKERSGLVLSADKQYLAESRLLPVARKAGLGTLSELVAVLKRGNAEALVTAMVEAMMTSESLFFRDKVPFEHFRSTILPALKAARRTSRTIRIWCAAAATGQEPYSLAICLKEMERDIAGASISWRTDLSNEVLGKAGGDLQPVRGATGAADPPPDQVFHAVERSVAAHAEHSRHGQIPAGQSDVGLLPPGHVRSDLAATSSSISTSRRRSISSTGLRRSPRPTAISCSARPRQWWG